MHRGYRGGSSIRPLNAPFRSGERNAREASGLPSSRPRADATSGQGERTSISSTAQPSQASPALQSTSQTRDCDTSTVVRLVNEVKQSQSKVESLCRKVLEQQSKTISEVQELKEMIAEQRNKNFSFKQSGYETALRREIANLYCCCITRYPETEDLQTAVRKVLSTEDRTKRYIVEACLKGARELLCSFRTEERRRVLGHKPTANLCFLPTQALAKNLLEYMKAPINILEDIYTKHLTILRIFVREHPGCSETKNFHAKFKQWLTSSHPAINDDQWACLVETDLAHEYDKYPLCKPALERGEPSPIEVRDQAPDVDINDDVVVNSDMYSFERL